MKEIRNRIADVLKVIFGYGILITLFVGGLTFFGYLAALVIGGESAGIICEFIYKSIVPIMIKVSTSVVLLGLLVMYLRNETALTATGKKKK